MTNNSQTLQDLANSAKANQDAFNNTLIEIHKQSACEIVTALTQTYNNEISEIKTATKNELSAIASEMREAKETILSEMKPAIIQSLLRGTSLIILVVSLIAGFFLNFWIYNKRIDDYQAEINTLRTNIQALDKWQIPANYRYSEQDKITKRETRYLILPQSTHKMKDGTKLYRIHNGGL